MGCLTSSAFCVSLQVILPYEVSCLSDYIISLLEQQVGIIVACMPTMSHTCRHILRSYERIKKDESTEEGMFPDDIKITIAQSLSRGLVEVSDLSTRADANVG